MATITERNTMTSSKAILSQTKDIQNILDNLSSLPEGKLERYKFFDNNNKPQEIYYAIRHKKCLIRAVDIWRAVTGSTGNFSTTHMDIDGDYDRIYFPKASGCPSTRPTYAVTIPQALAVCAKNRKGAHGAKAAKVEWWILNKLAPLVGWKPEPEDRAKAPDPEPKAQLTTGKNGVPIYSVRLPIEGGASDLFEGTAWRLSPKMLADKVLWPDRLGIDLADLVEIFNLTAEEIAGFGNRTFPVIRNGVRHDVLDYNGWNKFKELPAIKDDVVAVAGFDELYELDRSKPELLRELTIRAPQPEHPKTITLAETPKPPSWPLLPIPSSAPLKAHRFGFRVNDHRVVHICAALEKGQLWIARRDLNAIFGDTANWPASVKNAPRRILQWDGTENQAICETHIQDLIDSQPVDVIKTIGVKFKNWLAVEVTPALKSPAPPVSPVKTGPALTGRLMNFFFLGRDYDVRVADDEAGNLWAATPDLEKLFEATSARWPQRALKAQIRAISHGGAEFSAIPEEFIDDVARIVSPSVRARAAAFSKWWIDAVMPVFSMTAPKASAEPVAPKPEQPTGDITLSQQARRAAELLIKLADENDAQRAEIESLKGDAQRREAEKAKIEEAKAEVAKQAAAIQNILDKLKG